MLPFQKPALVVDDSAAAASIMRDLVRRIGFVEVAVRHTAAEGLLELQRRRHAFALIDVEMKPSSGLDLLEWIRRSEEIWSTPIVIATATPVSLLLLRRWLWRIAPTSFILKPFSAGDLKRKLSQMLERPSVKQDLLPSEIANRYNEWAPSGKRADLEATLITRISRVQFEYD